ncbi:glycosyltransferase family 4 protein [Pantoea sp. 1.19]|uniref:glycosyltransferase family 4 protein n=1 Tax=Pantoea sp. 1.19 TaxID=1925589 RepID=UPI000948DF50|nr:glycosyltransferase family 4 protein [Pantoea sp. 1.19]
MTGIRLALVRQKYRPDGGAERFVARALQALQAQQLDLNVITREWQGERNPDWHLHLCNPPKWGRISRERGFAAAARALWQRERFDLVQSHERIAGCDIYRAGDGVHRRWLQQRARILPAWRGSMLMASRYHRYVMAAERAMYEDPALRAVICNAEMIKQEIIADFGLPEENIHVIYNAIDSDRFMPGDAAERAAQRARVGIPAAAHTLIFVGSGFERKGLAAALQALSRTDSYLLVIGQDKARSRYEALANSLGCGARVRFLGVQKETLPWYQAADGLLLPTLYDPFPNVILEALACGLPVITSTTCGGAEFIRRGHNGYVCDALDIPALTAAIAALAASPQAQRLSDNARDTILPHSPARLSAQLVGLYQGLLGHV